MRYDDKELAAALDIIWHKFNAVANFEIKLELYDGSLVPGASGITQLHSLSLSPLPSFPSTPLLVVQLSWRACAPPQFSRKLHDSARC